MYSEGLPYKPFFITLILYGEIVIGSTKKLVAYYVVGNLAFLDQVYENINAKINILLWLISHVLQVIAS